VNAQKATDIAQKPRGRWGVWKTFVIGRQDNPMMKRLRVVQTPWFGLYVHFIYREDLDPVPHDHPWTFWRMVLRGGYHEDYLWMPSWPYGAVTRRFIQPLRPGRVPTAHAHRIVQVKPGTVSLVLVGRKSRAWGFWVHSQTETGWTSRWVDFRDALGLRPTEGVHSDSAITPGSGSAS
jgi:hypothetical protein